MYALLDVENEKLSLDVEMYHFILNIIVVV